MTIKVNSDIIMDLNSYQTLQISTNQYMLMLKVWKPRIMFNCIAKKMQCKSEKVYLWINEGIQPGIENQ